MCVSYGGCGFLLPKGLLGLCSLVFWKCGVGFLMGVRHSTDWDLTVFSAGDRPPTPGA